MWAETELLRACAENNVKNVQSMLLLGASPKTYNLLPYATAKQLSRNPQVAYYPLQIAAIMNSAKITSVLLSCKTIDPLQTDRHGQTALIAACKHDNVNVAKLLVTHTEALLNMPSFFNSTPLLTCVLYKSYKCMEFILSTNNSNVNYAVKTEWQSMQKTSTALMRAVEVADVKAVRLLLTRSDIAISTAVYLKAADSGVPAILQELLLQKCKLLSLQCAWCKYLLLSSNKDMMAIIRVFSAITISERTFYAMTSASFSSQHIDRLINGGIICLNAIIPKLSDIELTTLAASPPKTEYLNCMLLGWSRKRHVLYTNNQFRDTVNTLLLVHCASCRSAECRIDKKKPADKNTQVALLVLPPEIWLYIVCFLQYKWYTTPACSFTNST